MLRILVARFVAPQSTPKFPVPPTLELWTDSKSARDLLLWKWSAHHKL